MKENLQIKILNTNLPICNQSYQAMFYYLIEKILIHGIKFVFSILYDSFQARKPSQNCSVLISIAVLMKKVRKLLNFIELRRIIPSTHFHHDSKKITSKSNEIQLNTTLYQCRIQNFFRRLINMEIV